MSIHENADKIMEQKWEEWWTEFLKNNSETIAALELIKPFMKRAWVGAWVEGWVLGYGTAYNEG